jgi:hypothetical protein
VGDRVFDLAAPIEWRGIVFQEGLGQAIAVYQGTWIRQGSSEIVLVSLLPSIMSAGAQGITENGSLAGLDRSVLRDLRLMQAVPEEPPPASSGSRSIGCSCCPCATPRPAPRRRSARWGGPAQD